MGTYGAFCTIEKQTDNKWHPLPLLLRSTCANIGICPTCHISPQNMTQKSTSSQHNVASGFSWKGHFFYCHSFQFHHHLACKFDSTISAAWLMTSKLRTMSQRQSNVRLRSTSSQFRFIMRHTLSHPTYF